MDSDSYLTKNAERENFLYVWTPLYVMDHFLFFLRMLIISNRHPEAVDSKQLCTKMGYLQTRVIFRHCKYRSCTVQTCKILHRRRYRQIRASRPFCWRKLRLKSSDWPFLNNTAKVFRKQSTKKPTKIDRSTEPVQYTWIFWSYARNGRTRHYSLPLQLSAFEGRQISHFLSKKVTFVAFRIIMATFTDRPTVLLTISIGSNIFLHTLQRITIEYKTPVIIVRFQQAYRFS